MVIFKRKRMPKDPISAGIVLHYHEHRWMDEEGMKLWVRKVWCTRPGGLLKKPSLLVYDSFRGHLVPSVQKRIAEANRDTCVIPGGLTSQLQPLDVCLNKPFKQRVRMKWTEWLMDKDKHSFTLSGYMRMPNITTVCTWVKWDDLSPDIINGIALNSYSIIRVQS